MYKHTRLEYDAKASAEKQAQDQIHLKYKEWVQKNGIIVNGVEYPALYGPNGVLRGLRSTRDIQPFEAIIAIPQKNLIISNFGEEDPELKPAFRKYPAIFDRNVNDKAHINCWIAYMVRERLRGEKSHYKEFLDTLPAETRFCWQKPEARDQIKDPILKKIMLQQIERLEAAWTWMQKFDEENPGLFDQKVTKDVFSWVYYSGVSRTFTTGMPGMTSTPVIEFFNHAPHDNQFFAFLIHKKYEQMPDDQAKMIGYNKETKGIDMSPVFPDWKPAAPKPVLKHHSIQFVERFKGPVANYQHLNERRSHELAANLAMELLQKHNHVQVWDIPDWANNFNENDPGLENADFNTPFEEQEKNLEELIKDPQSRKEYTGKEVQTVAEAEKDKPKSKVLDCIQEGKLDTRKISWYKVNDPDVYVIAWNRSDTVIPKGSELKLLYGHDSNTQLNSEYGFALEENDFDSIRFRLISDNLVQKLKLSDPLFYDLLEGETFQVAGETFPAKELSQEFRVKKHRFNIHLMMELRHRHTPQVPSWKVTDLKIEEQVLIEYRKVFETFLSKYSRPEAEFKELESKFQQGLISFDVYSLLLCERSFFNIAKSQLHFCDFIKEVIASTIAHPTKSALKEIYTSKLDGITAFETVHGCSKYLEQLYAKLG